MLAIRTFFYTGGPLFMGILTILLMVILAVSVLFAILIARGKAAGNGSLGYRLSYVKSLGLFTMISGILGQLVGLTEAFEAIEHVGDISPSILAGGLKVSMYTTIYGILIYLLSILIWFLLDLWHHKKMKS